MQVTIRPQLALSADGSTALVTAAAGRVGAFDVGGGALLAEHPARDVQAVALSAGGSALAVANTAGELLVHRDGGWTVHSLPRRAAALAISDDGTRAALLLGGRPARVELWTLDAAGPGAAVDAGAGGRGELQADGELALLAVWLGDVPAGPAPQALLTASLDEVAGFPGPAAAATVVHAGRAWVAGQDAVTVWTAEGEAGTLPGTLRDRIAPAPGGGHVLVHRAERDLGDGAVRVTLRAFALPSLDPAGEAQADVAAHSSAALALTDELEVRAVRATDDGGIAVERIARLSP